MKTFFNEKSWLFTLSVAFMASSAWTPVSAQDTKTKAETKVTIIRTTSNENSELFEPTKEQSFQNGRSGNTWTFYKSSNNSCDKTTTSNKPKLGVLLKGSEKGTVILKTFPNSAAEEAGLLAGDKILSINGKASESIDGLINLINEYKVGDKVTLVYQRDGKENTSIATLKTTQNDHYLHHRTKYYTYKSTVTTTETLSENACEQLDELYGKPFLGVYLSNSYQENGTGARLSSVIKETGAFKAELRAEDKIIKMNNQAISSTKEAIAFIQSKNPGDRVRIRLIRDGKEMMIPAVLGSWADNPNVKWKVATLEENCERNAPEEPVKDEDNARVEPNKNSFNSLEKEASMEVFPNPTSDVVNIKFEGDKAPLTINIISLDGKEMFSKTIANFGGTYNDQMDLSKYPAGVYIVNLKQGEKQLSQQVVVE